MLPKEQPCGGSRVLRGVIFFLSNLPFDFDADDDGTVPDLPYREENLAATHLLPLNEILSSRLNAAGLVHSIYVHFGPKGYYELNPNTNPITQPPQFEEQLRDLFRDGIIINPTNNQVIWRKINDLSTLLSCLPSNSRKIGCLHGPDHVELTKYLDYVKTVPNQQISVFVVGQINTQEIQPIIDDFVSVSDYDLIPAYCLDNLISATERKWGIS